MNETRLVCLERRADALGDVSIHLLPLASGSDKRRWFAMITLFALDELGDQIAVHDVEAEGASLEEAFSRALEGAESWAVRRAPSMTARPSPLPLTT